MMIRFFLFTLSFVVAVATSCVSSTLVQDDSVVRSLVFSSEKTSFEEISKTAWDNSANDILWQPGDAIRIAYTCDGVWENSDGTATATEVRGIKTARTYASERLTTAGPIAQFRVPAKFTNRQNGTYQFYGVYPESACTDGEYFKFAPDVLVEIPAIQTPLADSFDSAADLMVSKSVETFTGLPSGPISLCWYRVVAQARLTLNALNGFTAGEKITAVEISTNDQNANLVGKYYVNLTDRTAKEVAGNVSNKLIINGQNLQVDAQGNVIVWATFLPHAFNSFNIKVTTDKATYVRELPTLTKPLNFLANRRNLLTINMAKATRTALPPVEVEKTMVVDFEQPASAYPEWKFTNITSQHTHSKISSGAGGKGLYASTSGKTTADIQTVSAIVSPKTISFYVATQSTSTQPATWFVEVSSDKSAWQEVTRQDGSYSSTNRHNWIAVNADLSAYSNVYVRVRFVGAYTAIRNIDNITLTYSCSGSAQPSQDVAPAAVVTNGAAEVSVNTATLNANFTGASDVPVEAGFFWGNDPANLTKVQVATPKATSGSFSHKLTDLVEGTPYYFQSYVVVKGKGVYAGMQEVFMASGLTEFRASSPITPEPEPKPEPTPQPDPNPNPTPGPTPPAGPVKPAVNETWLELPGFTEGSQYLYCKYSGDNSAGRNYTQIYDINTYTPYWTAYPLSSKYLGTGRTGSWKFSPQVPQEYQIKATGGSYSRLEGVQYSRGHMLPNASRSAVGAYQQETFYVTNQVPQIQNSFNSGIWSSLEEALRTEAGTQEIYVVTGTVFNKVGENLTIKTITPAKATNQPVKIANWYYKCVLKVKKNSNGEIIDACTIGFWYWHQAYPNGVFSDPAYVFSVNQLEQWTGFDFFVNLPDGIEEKAESQNTSWAQFTAF